MRSDLVLGIDIGGSSIKGGIVDVTKGSMYGERYVIGHQQRPELETLVTSIFEIKKKSDFDGNSIGIGFPGVVSDREIFNGPNMGADLPGLGLCEYLSKLGQNSKLINDADAALYHAMRNQPVWDGNPTVLLVTIGTSLGTALCQDGKMFRNLELGRLLDGSGKPIDTKASMRAVRELDLGIEQWASNLSLSIRRISDCVSPDLILLGGGVTEEPDDWLDLLDVDHPIYIAPGSNAAGLIGAACWCFDNMK
tara:strand:- start:12 stop:764 length:753 start_codon:yes stop_codon:yes gene_type:complete